VFSVLQRGVRFAFYTGVGVGIMLADGMKGVTVCSRETGEMKMKAWRVIVSRGISIEDQMS